MLAILGYFLSSLRLRADEYAIVFAMITVSLGFAWSVAVPFSISIFNTAWEKQWWYMGYWVSTIPGALEMSPLFGVKDTAAALADFTKNVYVPMFYAFELGLGMITATLLLSLTSWLEIPINVLFGHLSDRPGA